MPCGKGIFRVYDLEEGGRLLPSFFLSESFGSELIEYFYFHNFR